MILSIRIFGRGKAEERAIERRTDEVVEAIRTAADESRTAVRQATETAMAERRRLVEAARVASGNHLRDIVLGANEPAKGGG